MFAVIKSGGRQYKVSVGEILEVNSLPVEEGEEVRLEEILLISDADRTLVGTPFVANAAVVATATRHGRGEKVVIFKYKSKKRIRHRRGHRQEVTYLTIEDILADGKSLVTGEKPSARAKKSESTPKAEKKTSASKAAATTESTATEEANEKKTRRRRTTKAAEETQD
ncbi:MAG TPA: 50S ribosomal protein L21 [Ktedonobacteraceae bacterium]|nr:50S ribosomal protein L21 [Ktedonobacteraceae bacterium]